MMPLLGIVAEIQNFLRITKINLGETSNERGECIFIPLKIAKRKRYKNAVDGVVLAAIQIAVDPIKCRTDGTSAFNTRTAR
jgi:ATP/ADP translocase